MERPETCPECGSSEIFFTKRVHDIDIEIKAWSCSVCHWVSDPRIGRPPADRGKNLTLRRLVADAKDEKEHPSES